MTNELKILSAGAVKPGLTKVIDAFQRDSGNRVQVAFATAPAIVKQIGDGATVDVVIAPPGVLEQLVKSGKYAHAQGCNPWPNWRRRLGARWRALATDRHHERF